MRANDQRQREDAHGGGHSERHRCELATVVCESLPDGLGLEIDAKLLGCCLSRGHALVDVSVVKP
jgi:hypothetical protein